MQQTSAVSSHAMSAKRKRNIGKNVVHPTTMQPPDVRLDKEYQNQQQTSSTNDSKRIEISKNPSTSINVNQETGRTLDGFFLLDCCRGKKSFLSISCRLTANWFTFIYVYTVEFPDEASQVVLSGLNITQVVAEDLLYFSNLARIDMSDNEAPLEPFGCLPGLVEMDFQCNALQKISLTQISGFHNLEVLNLSYNCLTSKDVEELSSLLKIRELYLANNMILSLPPIMVSIYMYIIIDHYVLKISL